uniref:DDE Tnp4 domain-containing protein n=1 Tax=Oncorhynchus kisutch TaxID=8019 RepID=A0A8C7M1F1_ONCKI
YQVVQELLLDPARHHRYFQMSAEEMETLLSFVGPDLTKQMTNYWTPKEPKQRLAVTLRLVIGKDSICSLAFTHCLGFGTVLQCIMETCEAIERRMLVTHWRCFFIFYYKGTFSVVLLALVDDKYCFTAIQVGDFGRNSDDGVYANSPFGRAMASNSIKYTLLGDAAGGCFPLKPSLIRPYAGHNIMEKAFGILAARWRILYKKINLLPCKVDTLVVATCIPHNILTKPCDLGMWLQQKGAGVRQCMKSIAI